MTIRFRPLIEKGNLLFILLILCINGCAAPQKAQRPTPPIVEEELAQRHRIFYAGFAFISDYENIGQNFKHSFRLSRERESGSGLPVLENALRSRMSHVKTGNMSVVVSELGQMNKGEGLAMAFALDNETVSIEKIRENYKLVIDLGAQILFFDFDGMKVIGAYPIAIQFIDILTHRPSDKEISQRIRDLYLSRRHNLNIFDEFKKRLATIFIKPKFSSSIGVSKVWVEERAYPFLPPGYRKNSDSLNTFLAQHFSKYLSSNQSVSILPYSKGHAIGKKMAARFSDGRVYMLKIPEADYEIELTLRGFKKKRHDQTTIGSSWLYGAYIRLKIWEPLLPKVYMDKELVYAVTKIVPATQTMVSDWPAYQEALFSLFDSFTKEVSTQKIYKPVKEVLVKCK